MFFDKSVNWKGATVPTFMQMLQAGFDQGKFVCVGLDTDPAKLPKAAQTGTIFGSMNSFNQGIVDATHDLVLAYKPNFAFYEGQGVAGIQALKATIDYIKQVAPDVPVILDFKRGDIGNTNMGSVGMAFDYLGADAITINPYMGQEANQVFLDRADKGVIVLCRTSNRGAGEFQDRLVIPSPAEGRRWGLEYIADGSRYSAIKLYELVAHQVTEKWNANGNCAVVVGATNPAELARVRAIVGEMPILLPGIGAQGGDLEATAKAGANSRGQGMIINNARGVIFAVNGKTYPRGARRVVLGMNRNVHAALAAR